jgi:hypothetical protein
MIIDASELGGDRGRDTIAATSGAVSEPEHARPSALCTRGARREVIRSSARGKSPR